MTDSETINGIIVVAFLLFCLAIGFKHRLRNILDILDWLEKKFKK